MTPPVTADDDPARPPERTRLSWHRTVLAAGVVGLLAARLALLEALTTARLAVVAIAVIGWLLIALAGAGRAAIMSATAPPPPRWSIRAAAVVAVGYAMVGAVLVVLP